MDYLLFFRLATPRGLWDLSSLARVCTHALGSESMQCYTRSPENSQPSELSFNSFNRVFQREVLYIDEVWFSSFLLWTVLWVSYKILAYPKFMKIFSYSFFETLYWFLLNFVKTLPNTINPYSSFAKSLQSCPTLCDPMDCSLPGFSVHGILQARTLEWVAISFSNSSFTLMLYLIISKRWISSLPCYHCHLLYCSKFLP